MSSDILDYQLHRVLNSQVFKPNEIRHIENKLVINQVINNIVKSMKRKADKGIKIEENTLLLIIKDIGLKGNNYILKKNGKHNYNIPGIFIKYINDDKISVSIKITVRDNEIFKKII